MKQASVEKFLVAGPRASRNQLWIITEPEGKVYYDFRSRIQYCDYLSEVSRVYETRTEAWAAAKAHARDVVEYFPDTETITHPDSTSYFKARRAMLTKILEDYCGMAKPIAQHLDGLRDQLDAGALWPEQVEIIRELERTTPSGWWQAEAQG